VVARKAYRIILTGDREDLYSRVPSENPRDGVPLEWVQVPVLEFEKIPVEKEVLLEAVDKDKPFEWVMFTSSRAVRFFREELDRHGLQLPAYTQVACIGEQTARVAAEYGFQPDFFPKEAGSEKFLDGFEQMWAENSRKPRILLPMAESGRATVRERLTDIGCCVLWIPLYRTKGREDMTGMMNQSELSDAELVLFTSPSSVDAFLATYSLPDGIKIGAIGSYTAASLEKRGIAHIRTLPEADFRKIDELLC